MKKLSYIALFVMIGLLSSCGGGGAENTNYTTTTTLGQELSDLDKARQEGVISDSEYDTAKKKLLNRKN